MSTESVISPAVEFINRLQHLAEPGKEDRASLARLKRGAGRALAESASLMPLFYRLLPYSVRKPWEEEDYFLVATLFPFNPRRWTGDLGRSLRRLKAKTEVNEEGVDRRMAVLLDASRSELTFRLRQVVCLLAQHELPIDWRQLLEDLRWWEHEQRRVQKQWARSYFGWTVDEDHASVNKTAATEPNQD